MQRDRVLNTGTVPFCGGRKGETMIAMISPAMSMKLPGETDWKITRPQFLEDAESISKVLKKLTPWEFEEWMRLSPSLAEEAFVNARDFDISNPGSPAVLTFSGLVYRYLHPEDFSEEERAYAQEHLRILSGLYGVLRPLDGVWPYRLEMACRLPIDGKRLYAHWGRRIYENLFQRGEPVVNLASEEYAKTVRPFLEPGDFFLDVQFLVWRGGKYRTVTAWAKMARGAMARSILKNRWEDVGQLKDFEWEGFAFEEALSGERKYCFCMDSEKNIF